MALAWAVSAQGCSSCRSRRRLECCGPSHRRSSPACEGFGYEGYGYEPRRKMGPGEHTWRGGILGWLGAGIRAGAGWFGNTLQQWGTWFGGRVSGGTAEIGRAVRGRGEQMASALEDQDQRVAATVRRNLPPRYRRPDERILDDVWHRIRSPRSTRRTSRSR